MDVTFETTEGKHFTIEVGFFDRVLEMKEKIQKYQGIPISKQTFFFKNQVMSDDRDTEFYQVLQGSRIQLIVESEGIKPVKVEEIPKIHVLIKVTASNRQFSLDVDATENASWLKEKIQESEGVPASRLALFVSGVELQDHRTLGECGFSNHQMEVHVVFKPFSPPTGSKKLKFMVQLIEGSKKIMVEMNASDNVSELRKKLQRLQQHHHFQLPSEGYFFIYKQNLMEDDKSLRWHEVRQGDMIEIFSGRVTGA